MADNKTFICSVRTVANGAHECGRANCSTAIDASIEGTSDSCGKRRSRDDDGDGTGGTRASKRKETGGKSVCKQVHVKEEHGRVVDPVATGEIIARRN